MTRPRKPKANEETKSNNQLLEALTFLSLITKDVGSPNETHVSLSNNQATAYNGVLAAGHKIEENIFACPHNSTLIEALSKCGQYLSITQLDQYRLAIKSDKFKAIVPCLDPQNLQIAIPDPVITTIDDRFKIGLEAVSVLVNENAERIYAASILMNGQTLISTNNGVMIFEYWHGIDLPPNIAIPKSFANAIIKTSKKLKHFGFSQTSVTFYFEDDSWIKTQLYAEQWPDVLPILNRECNAWPLPGDFFKALAAVQPFSPDGLIHFDGGIMRSHASNDVGASYEVSGLPAGPIFAAKQLALLKPHVQTIDFLVDTQGCKSIMFYGPNIRGVIGGRKN